MRRPTPAPEYPYLKLAEAEEGLEKETEMATGENSYKMLGWVLSVLKDMRRSLRGSDNAQAELEVGNVFFLKVIEPVLKTESLEGSINPRASDFWNACETLLRLLGQRGDLQLQLRENDEVDNDAADAAEAALRDTDAQIAVTIQDLLALMNEQYEMVKDTNNRAAAVAGFEVERRELMHETAALLAQCDQDAQTNQAEIAQLEYSKQMTDEEYQGHVKATQTALTGVREGKAACVSDLEDIANQMAALARKAQEKCVPPSSPLPAVPLAACSLSPSSCRALQEPPCPCLASPPCSVTACALAHATRRGTPRQRRQSHRGASRSPPPPPQRSCRPRVCFPVVLPRCGAGIV